MFQVEGDMYLTVVVVTSQVGDWNILNCCYTQVSGTGGAGIDVFPWFSDMLERGMY
jgi:hypothetical protein